MFLNSDNISFEILTTLQLCRDGMDHKSDPRTYTALSMRTKGKAEFVSNNEVFHINQGDILLIPPEPEYLQKSEGEELYAIHFITDRAVPAAFKKFTPQNPEYFRLKFEELHSVWTKKQPGYKYESKSILYKILAKIEKEQAEAELMASNDKIIDAFEHIHSHFADRTLSIESLASLCGMSDTYFRKLFVERFSVTPLKYINRLKLNYAKELLLSDYYTVEEIAEKCGFNNINYFSLFIKKETGLSPTALKRSLK